jgi:hypothetical protein
MLDHIHSGSQAASEQLLQMAAESQRELAGRVANAMANEMLHASMFSGPSSPDKQQRAQSMPPLHPAAAFPINAPTSGDREQLPHILPAVLRSFRSSRSRSLKHSAELPLPNNLEGVSEEELMQGDDADQEGGCAVQLVPAVADLPLVRHNSDLERRIQRSIDAKWGGCDMRL